MKTDEHGRERIERGAYSVPEAGARLGIGRDLAYQLAKEGTLPTLRLGRRLVVPIAQLEQLLEGKR